MNSLPEISATRFRRSVDRTNLGRVAEVCSDLLLDIRRAKPSLNSWINFPLLNRSGDPSDLTLEPYDDTAKPTRYLERLSEVRSILDQLRDEGFQILYARIAVLLHRDVLRPHIDTYPAARLLIPLNESGTDFRHVFGNTCVVMRPGEVWGVDGSVVHGAANTGERAWRFLLLVDALLDRTPPWFQEVWTIPPERSFRRRVWNGAVRDIVSREARLALESSGLEMAERILLFAPFEYDLETAAVYSEIFEFFRRLQQETRNPDLRSALAARIERLRNPQLKFEISADSLPSEWEQLEEVWDLPPEQPPDEERYLHRLKQKSRQIRNHRG